MIKLILSAPVPEISAAFVYYFADDENVEVISKPFETIPNFDCMVSAANSFGLMDGGVDAAITAYFGHQLQKRVQQRIIKDWLGEQPVGTAFVIESGDSNHPWLVHAPTMRVPMIIDGTDAVYNATWAALLAVHRHNLTASEDSQIKSVVFPAMGAGCGQVAPNSVASQMKLAWTNFNNSPSVINWDYASARQSSVTHTSAYCHCAGVCPNAITKYIGLGEYRTFCSKTGKDCISRKHQLDDVMFGTHTHSLHSQTTISHVHSISNKATK
ncbi:macro domain-containing protein [Citrobacter braakii]|uniref:macro domain-containing protein n=1 Tax=Citrobacter braakii TaxID=57706 RepID=UPI001BCB8475|nr:macro domain-containing protein [Citrobacter braakii]